MGADKHVTDITNGNSSLPSQTNKPREGAVLLLTGRGERRKTERQAEEVISEVGATNIKYLLN